MSQNTRATAMINTTVAPIPPAMRAVLDGPDDESSLFFAASLDAVEVRAVLVAVESADVPCWDSMLAVIVEKKVEVPVSAVPKVAMMVCIGRRREPVVARSLITDAAATVKTLLSSLQQVLESEAQQ
jgi:hypothetical protein